MKDTCESSRLETAYATETIKADSQPSARPFVSIILCTRGLKSSLIHCLEHLTDQTRSYPCHEIIVVLNGRENPAFVRAVSRFRVRLLNEPLPGVSNARNYAVPRAKGDILVFLDDDVVTESNWLEEIVKSFEDPKVACVTGRVIPAGPLSLAKERAVRYYTSHRALSAWSLDASDPKWCQYILGEPVGFGCNMAFRKTFLEQYSLFPPDLGAGSLIGGGDEFYMYVQAIKHGFRIRHTPAAAVTHFFDDDIEKQRIRSAQLYAGSVAFALKLFLEEKTLRLATAKWVISALKRRVRSIWHKKAIASEPQELLSPGEKFRTYLRGIGVYWKSRRLKSPFTPQS